MRILYEEVHNCYTQNIHRGIKYFSLKSNFLSLNNKKNYFSVKSSSPPMNISLLINEYPKQQAAGRRCWPDPTRGRPISDSIPLWSTRVCMILIHLRIQQTTLSADRSIYLRGYFQSLVVSSLSFDFSLFTSQPSK